MSKLSKEIDAYQERGHDPEPLQRKTKMTPGPWFVEKRRDENLVRRFHISRIHPNPPVPGLCNPVVDTLGVRSKSDAIAIAALPDMVEALKAARETLGDSDEAMGLVAAALAKAGVE